MSLPDWADFMAEDSRYRAFLDGVRRAIEALGIDVELGEGRLRVRESGAGHVSLGLKSVAQAWHELGEGALGPVGDARITALLGAAHAQLRPDPALEAELEDLERARGRLRLRLFNERAAVALAVGLVQRRLTRGLFAVLALDLPASLRPVAPELLEGWGTSLAELWPLALEQTLAAPVEIEPLRLFERVPCLALTGDSLVTTSQLLGLEQILARELGEVPSLGALAVVPNRHTLLIHPLGVHEVEVSTALQALRHAGGTLYEQGPGSLSPEINWWRAGSLEHIRTGRDRQGRLQLGAPEAFMREVLGEGS